jgi:CRISPR/Cas system CSM-associated protein Csm3 (group 7 of RAMP superfamily)
MNRIHLLHITLIAQEPFAITAPEVAQDSDLPPARDPRTGFLVVPGTSAAGSMRAHVQRTLGPDRTTFWFGPNLTSHQTDIEASSFVRIVGTRVTLNDSPITQTVHRAQTAIDRVRGAATAMTLRDSLYAPTGTKIEVFARIDEPDDRTWDQTHVPVANGTTSTVDTELIESLKSWFPYLGRASNSGVGATKLHSLNTGLLDLDHPDDRWKWICGEGPQLFQTVCTHSALIDSEPPPPLVAYTLRARSPIRIGGGQTDRNRRYLYNRDGAYTFEGSSIRGVLRSRCEYIVRSLCHATNSAVNLRATELLFGTTDQRGCLRVESAPIRNPQTGFRPHVAIDRISGGARAGALFFDEVIEDGTFTIQISSPDAHALPPWTTALLGAALCDLHDGLIGIGASVTRGCGSAEITDEPLPTADLSSFVNQIVKFEQSPRTETELT